jgi:hypothetical protein
MVDEEGGVSNAGATGRRIEPAVGKVGRQVYAPVADGVDRAPERVSRSRPAVMRPGLNLITTSRFAEPPRPVNTT